MEGDMKDIGLTVNNTEKDKQLSSTVKFVVENGMKEKELNGSQGKNTLNCLKA